MQKVKFFESGELCEEVVRVPSLVKVFYIDYTKLIIPLIHTKF